MPRALCSPFVLVFIHLTYFIIGQGATGTNRSIGSSVWTRGRNSSLWGWRSPGTGCPGRLWSLLLWRYSRPAWTKSWAACSGWPCFGRRVGLDDPQRSLSTPTVLCDSVILWQETEDNKTLHCDTNHEAGWKICSFGFSLGTRAVLRTEPTKMTPDHSSII